MEGREEAKGEHEETRSCEVAGRKRQAQADGVRVQACSPHQHQPINSHNPTSTEVTHQPRPVSPVTPVSLWDAYVSARPSELVWWDPLIRRGQEGLKDKRRRSP